MEQSGNHPERDNKPGDVFFNAIRKGNQDYPQMATGVNLYGGAAILPLIGTDFSWRQFYELTMPQEQFDKAEKRMLAYHNAFNIAIPPKEKILDLYPPTKEDIITASVRFITGGTRSNTEANVATLQIITDKYSEDTAGVIGMFQTAETAIAREKALILRYKNEWRDGGSQEKSSFEIKAPYMRQLREIIEKSLRETYPQVDPFKIRAFMSDTVKI